MIKKEKILITGGAGFIGSHTADALSKYGYKIRILDSLESPVHQNHRWPKYVLGKGYELIKGRVEHKPTLEKSLKGVSFVYHFAAYQDQRQDFSNFFKINTTSSALLYEIIHAQKIPVRKIILASTQFVYGDGKYLCPHSRQEFFAQPRTLSQLEKKDWSIRCSHGSPAKFIPFKEDQQLTPTNSYGLSKEAAEKISLRLGQTYGVPATCLRYSIVQGDRQSPYNLYSGALRIFISQAILGVPLSVYEDGLQSRDFIDINDIVSANLLVLKNPKTNFEVFNIGSGQAYKVLDFAKLVKKITHSDSKINLGSFRRTDTRHAVSNISKIKKLGWRPRFSTTDSIHKYITWFKKEKFNQKLKTQDFITFKEGLPL